jgi:hypothetical protein
LKVGSLGKPRPLKSVEKINFQHHPINRSLQYSVNSTGTVTVEEVVLVRKDTPDLWSTNRHGFLAKERLYLNTLNSGQLPRFA